ncbi:MAG: radical SAM protein [Lachnospiraceae bacterium]|nr:radical SAM protein [Lachnospiraceae bacterium]
MGVDRLRVGTDGEGVVTLVGFFGCPLRCVYCLNPQCHRERGRLWLKRIHPPGQAGKQRLSLSGKKEMKLSPLKLYKAVKRDEVYFRMSGGGVVFGGGEPLLNSRYIKKFARFAAGRWKIRVETSLNVEHRHMERLIGVVDEWIIDIKDANPEIYKRYTGKDNRQVLDNCKKLSEMVSREKIHIRIPRIPDYNTEKDVEKSVRLFEKYGRTEVFSYILK